MITFTQKEFFNPKGINQRYVLHLGINIIYSNVIWASARTNCIILRYNHLVQLTCIFSNFEV